MRSTLFVLARLTDADIDVLLAAGRRERVDPGGKLVTQGVRTAYLDVILDGSFEVRGGPGEKTLFKQLYRGEVVGEVSFLDERPPTASVVAVEPSKVLRVPKPILLQRLGEDSGFAARFYHAIGTTLAYRMRDLLEKQTQATSGAEDELELDMLDDVDLAARRFDQHIARLLG